MSDYNTGSDLDVEKHQDAYTVVNARVGIGASDNRWSLALWGTNITDTEYVQVGLDGPLQNVSPLPGNPYHTFTAFPGAPRMYGVTLRVRSLAARSPRPAMWAAVPPPVGPRQDASRAGQECYGPVSARWSTA